MSSLGVRAVRAGFALTVLAGVVTLSGCIVVPAYPAGAYVRPGPVAVTPNPYPRYPYRHYPRYPYGRW
jgi:hypothetical protein